MALDSPGTHFLLHGFVCGASCFRPSPFEGWVTFTQIFQYRPDRCRYAIGRRLELANEGKGMSTIIVNRLADEWIAWDLYELDRMPVRPGGWVDPPPPLWSAENPDALVMKAMALYDR